MAGSPAQKPAEHIAAALVGWHDAVRDHKGTGFDMVGHDPQGNVCFIVLLVFFSGQLAYPV